jgi:hypothetical protein
MPIGILNLGGVRGEDAFFKDLPVGQVGEAGVRVEFAIDKVLPGLLEQLKRTGFEHTHTHSHDNVDSDEEKVTNIGVFKDMLS